MFSEQEIKERCESLKKGGSWLGAARTWMQWHVNNGASVTWGSTDRLTKEFTVKDIEEIAQRAVEAYIIRDNNEYELTKKRQLDF